MYWDQCSLISIFISDADRRITRTLNKFMNNTKIHGLVDTQEGWDAIQRDLDRLEQWAQVNLMRSNKSTWVEAIPTTNTNWVLKGLSTALWKRT